MNKANLTIVGRMAVYGAKLLRSTLLTEDLANTVEKLTLAVKDWEEERIRILRFGLPSKADLYIAYRMCHYSSELLKGGLSNTDPKDARRLEYAIRDWDEEMIRLLDKE